MFKLKIYSRHYECLSTETKQTAGIENGSTLTEIDTGDEFVFSGTGWVPKIVKTEINGGLAKSVYSITPSDTIDLEHGPTVGLYVGVDGDVVVITDGGTEITFKNLSGGMIHPISVKRIKTTGTTATSLLAVY